jgi:hypothetical protein
MGTEEFTLKTQVRSSALVSLQSPSEQASHPTAEIFQQTIRAHYVILPSAPKSNLLFLDPNMCCLFFLSAEAGISIRGRVAPAYDTAPRTSRCCRRR